MPSTLQTFRPAEYHKGKESYISFYVTDPTAGKLVRRKIKLNHIRNATDRKRYAGLLCHQINEKLFAGWNPLLEKVSAKAVTVKDAVAKFLTAKERETRPDTMRTYRSSSHLFLKYLSSIGMADKYCMMIEKQHLLNYLERSMESCSSNRSWNNKAAFLYLLFDFFVQRGYTGDNPASGLPRLKVDEKQRTVINKADRQRIMEYFRENCPRFEAVMQLCFRLFIRPKEICMLQIGDIDFDNHLLRIPSQVSKNHKWRVLGLPDCIFNYFLTIRDYPPQWYIFADARTYAPGPKRILPTRISETWKAMREKLKLPGSIQFYSLKDSGITEMLESGVPPKIVKELAAHHSLEMTERYVHESDAKKILEWNTLEF